jgi:alanine dehydrogenase
VPLVLVVNRGIQIVAIDGIARRVREGFAEATYLAAKIDRTGWTCTGLKLQISIAKNRKRVGRLVAVLSRFCVALCLGYLYFALLVWRQWGRDGCVKTVASAVTKGHIAVHISNSVPAVAVSPTLFLTDAEVAQLSDWKEAIHALRNAYAAPVSATMVPPRSMARGDGIWLRSLTAISPNGGHMGCKLISASTKGRKASYLISLFDQQTMALSALIDGNRITGIRTAATAALAVDVVAPSRPLKVAVIGSGFEARGLLAALAAIRRFDSVKAFSPTPANRERFVEYFRREHAMQMEPAASAQAAVQGVDVVLCAARSRDESPVLLGEWLEPGMVVVSIGSTLAEQREVDAQVIARASLIVADMVDEVAHDTGDMLAARQAGVDFSGKLVSLCDLVSGQVQRPGPSDIVVYKSVGSALQDIITAEMLLDRARALGVGTPLTHSIVPIAK